MLALADAAPVLADTIEAALVRSYQNNPQLNAQRASVRFTDENVPQALSGYRPKVAITASAGEQYTDFNTTQGGAANTLVRSEFHGVNPPRGRILWVNGVRLHALDTGGDGPPVVLLHGNGATSADMDVSGLIGRLRIEHRVCSRLRHPAEADQRHQCQPSQHAPGRRLHAAQHPAQHDLQADRLVRQRQHHERPQRSQDRGNRDTGQQQARRIDGARDARDRVR